jgi:calcium/calmodulin-dependent protein kinase I
VVGTEEFMAPELLQRRSGIPYPADLWAMGVMAFRMLTREAAFSGAWETFQYLKNPEDLFPSKTLERCSVSQEAQAFIRALMQPIPEERPSTTEALEQAWIRPSILQIQDLEGGFYSE